MKLAPDEKRNSEEPFTEWIYQQIRYGHNRLSGNKLSVLCNSLKGLVLARMVKSPFSFVKLNKM